MGREQFQEENDIMGFIETLHGSIVSQPIADPYSLFQCGSPRAQPTGDRGAEERPAERRRRGGDPEDGDGHQHPAAEAGHAAGDAE
jgi:hypothetical protein